MTRRLFWLLAAAILLPQAAWATPHRIVSLTPGITEMLFALGLGSDVVGDTQYCNYPPAAASPRITKIGGVQANSERIVALRPDLIVGDAIATPNADARLAQMHLPVLAIRPDTINHVEASLLQIGQRAGVSAQAKASVAHMEAIRRAAHVLAERDPWHPRVLLVIGTGPLYVAGHGTFMDDVLAEAGGINAAGLTGYGTLSPETVLAHPPDMIVANARDQAALRADPVLRLLPAVRAGHFIPLGNGDTLERPGPRIVQGLLMLARALHARAK